MSIGMITGPIGGELQGWAAVMEQEEMNRQVQQEMARQRGFRSDATKLMDIYLPSLGSETANQQIGAGQALRQGLYGQYNAQPMAIGAQGFSQADQQRLSMEGSARGKLGGYSDWSNLQDIAASEQQNNLNRIISRATGSTQVFPWRMYDAQHSQDALAAAGQMIASMGGGSVNFAGPTGSGSEPTSFQQLGNQGQSPQESNDFSDYGGF